MWKGNWGKVNVSVECKVLDYLNVFIISNKNFKFIIFVLKAYMIRFVIILHVNNCFVVERD